jgi:hypothetical protein
MLGYSRESVSLTMGSDLGDRDGWCCVLDEAGQQGGRAIKQGRTST